MFEEVFGTSLANNPKSGYLVLALGFLFANLWYLVESTLLLC